jgi:uncharacterized membrane protein
VFARDVEAQCMSAFARCVVALLAAVLTLAVLGVLVWIGGEMHYQIVYSAYWRQARLYCAQVTPTVDGR